MIKSKNIKEECLVCESNRLEQILDFGMMALAGGFLHRKDITKEQKFPMRLYYCFDCYALQIIDIVDKDKIFNNYFYFSSAIGTLKKHFKKYALDVTDRFLKEPKKSTVLEIGCNDGVLLKPFSDLGIGNLIGVDPAKNVINSIKNVNAHLINNFFGKEVTDQILDQYGRVDIICANNVYAHLSNFREVSDGISRLLNNNGVFIFEVHYIDKIINEIQYDMIYHEHLFYHSYLSLNKHFSRYNMHIFDVKPIEIHGGSMRYYVSKKKSIKHQITKNIEKISMVEINNGFNQIKLFQNFSSKVMNHRKEFSKLIRKLKKEGYSIAGYGASGRANTLIQFCGFDREIIDYIIDDAPQKSGFLTPGSHIPIVNRDQAKKLNRPDYLIIFAWSFFDEIYARLKGKIDKKTKIILPFPEIKIVE